MVQDSGVEGPVLIFAALKLQQAVEQPLKGRRWNPPKQNTPHPRTREKLQQDGRRGTIMIKKSNPIPTRWVTHKLENNTKEILALL